MSGACLTSTPPSPGVDNVCLLPPLRRFYNGSSPEYASYPERLRAYGKVWDLRRPVLVDKSPGPTFRALPLVVSTYA